jgi:hypothetical protein
MRKLSILAVLLLLAACGASLGDLGGILGSPSPSTPSNVNGTVNFIDTSAQRIDLTVNTVNNLRSSQSSGSIYYDNRTQVQWQGHTYSPADLERGDEVSVHGFNDNGKYVADQITVTRNVRQ